MMNLKKKPPMETEINGIVLNGKFYKAEEQDMQLCAECDLYIECCGGVSDLHGFLLLACQYFGKENIFRFSPELTEKLKGE